MKYGLIGEHLPHSYSKEIHEAFAPYTYELLELPPDGVAPFLREADFSAINVTIPYKQVVMPHLKTIHEAARRIGAVNTIVKRGGALHGYNTDFFGLSALVAHAGISLSGKRVLILGTGGTAHTARAVAKAEGAAEVLTVTRHATGDYVSYEEAYLRHGDAEIIFNTTPCGMYPYPDGTESRAGTPIDIRRFPHLLGVVDAVYNPLRTNLVLDARAAGIPAEGGLYMLVAQAVVASRIFLGQEIEEAVADEETVRITRSVYAAITASKENIVLTGMPGSGKSTVGRLLAEALGRPFVDTDAEIVKEAGREIPEIFRAVGEGGFREIEAKIVKRVASETVGGVIATGGGAILSDANVRALSRTGRLFFLDRPLSALLPTADRPLASSAEDIRRRYQERYPRYLATADVTVKNESTPEDAVSTIRKELML